MAEEYAISLDNNQKIIINAKMIILSISVAIGSINSWSDGPTCDLRSLRNSFFPSKKDIS